MITDTICPLCGSGNSDIAFCGRDRLHKLPGEFQVSHCSECGLLWVAPRPPDLQSYYPETYAPHQPAGDVFSSWRTWGLRSKATLLQRVVPSGGALLDVGCATGEFLALFLGNEKWQLYGLENSRRAAQLAKEQFGLAVTTASLPHSGWKGSSLDVITMWHVLEHLPGPIAALKEVDRLLRPGGRLIFACPVSDSWQARLFGASWAGYDVPRHLITFSRRTIHRALAAAGFAGREVHGVVMGLEMLRQSFAFRFPRWPDRLRWGATLLISPPLWLLEKLTGREAVATFIVTRRIDA